MRLVIPMLTVIGIAGLAAAPLPAAAQDQSRGYQNGATASGDPWLNEHDFDYNRRHWVPNPDQGNYDQRYRRDYGRNDYRDYGREDQRYPTNTVPPGYRYGGSYDNGGYGYRYDPRSSGGYYRAAPGYDRSPYPDDDE